MSDPFFFSFNVLDKKRNIHNPRMLCHGVVFTSFLVDSDERQIKICDIDDDPRMAHFVRFVYSNWLKKYSADTHAAIQKVEKEILERTNELVKIRAEIAELKKFHEQHTTKPQS